MDVKEWIPGLRTTLRLPRSEGTITTQRCASDGQRTSNPLLYVAQVTLWDSQKGFRAVMKDAFPKAREAIEVFIRSMLPRAEMTSTLRPIISCRISKREQSRAAALLCQHRRSSFC